jgi:Beta/Gamma crystallin
MAQLILFTDADFRGEHKHVFDEAQALHLLVPDPALNITIDVDGDFPDGVSSIVILSGNWQFFRQENLVSPFPVVLGPGLYRFVGNFKLVNDQIRSMTTVDAEPTLTGDPLDGHLILFEHAQFRGQHQHVFEPVPDLGVTGFDNITSSLVVETGNWSLFSDTQFDGSFPQQPVFGPGIYPWVVGAGLQNDAISSLRPTDAQATVSNAVDNEVLIFQYGAFFGPHRHVFAGEPNLNASDDSSFNDKVGSLVVLAGDWSFYSDSDFDALDNVFPAGPGTYPDLAAIDVLPDDMSSLRPAVPAQVTEGQDITGHVILFQNARFRGPHKHVFNAEGNLNSDDDDSFNDSVSSIVVISGNWRFFRNSGFDDDYPVVLGPGLYSWVEDFEIRNDDISSLQVTDVKATVTGEPLNAHIMLFEHAGFHGAHLHVFAGEPDLGADDDEFSNITSSIAVVSGVWEICADPDFGNPYAPIIGPGLYSWVGDFGIPNDDLTSLQPSEDESTVGGAPLLAHLMLFENAAFRGAHKHVLVPEPNLNADDDDSFNDATSSVAVLLNQWFTYRDAGFTEPFDVTLGEGLFPSVTAVGIANDAVSSLQVAQTRLQFTGQATISVASGQLPEPVTDDLAMTFLFDPASRSLQVETPFAVLTLGTLATMAYDRSDPGTFPADGQVTIPNLTVILTANVDGFTVHMNATFSLGTGTVTSPDGRYTVTGSPADAAGNTTLVAVGQLNGDDFAIQIAGVFSPRPA